MVNRLSHWFTKPKMDDIIAFHDPRDGKILIKRIAKKNRTRYFVEGDNKSASNDTRVFGWIEKRDIIGKVLEVKSSKCPQRGS